MRRKDKEIIDREKIDEILNRAEIIRIAMSENDKPYIVCVNFGYDGDSIYFHSAKEGLKLDMIAKNPNVCFQTEIDAEVIKSDLGCDWTEKYKSVVGFGKAEILTKKEDKRNALSVMMEKYSPGKTYELPDKTLNIVTTVKIKIDEIYGKQNND